MRRRAFLALFGLTSGACSLLALDGLSDGEANPANSPPDAEQESAAVSDDGDGGGKTPDDAAAGVDALVESAYAKAVLEDKPRAYYRFEDEPGSTFATDVIGAFHGKYQGAPSFGATGIAGSRAIKIPIATPACVEVEHNGAFDFAGRASPMTIEMWIRPTTFKNYLWLISSEPGITPRIGWTLLAKDMGILAFEQWAGGTSGDQLSRFATNEFDPQGRLVANQFSHVVLRMTDAGGTLFINTRNVYNVGNPTIVSVPGQKKIYIGCRSDGVDARFFFEDGILDELAIYDHPLPDLRIKTHYDLGKTP